MKQSGKSKTLGLLWRKIPSGIEMSDGIIYTDKELDIIRKNPSSDLMPVVHITKEVFKDSEVIR